MMMRDKFSRLKVS